MPMGHVANVATPPTPNATPGASPTGSRPNSAAPWQFGVRVGRCSTLNADDREIAYRNRRDMLTEGRHQRSRQMEALGMSNPSVTLPSSSR